MYKYILSVALLLFPFGISLADLSVSTSDGKSVTVATVNIYNATTTTTEKNGAFTVDFDIVNSLGVQPDIKYGVFITQSTSKGEQLIADQKVYDEVLSLSPKETLHKHVVYTPSPALSGSFDFFIEARNENGLPLTTAYVGKVSLPLLSQGVYIDPSSCFLTVKDEKGNPHYNLVQGVDITQTETLLAHCSIINNVSSAQNLVPQFMTHWRTVYGVVVSDTGRDTTPISIISKELKDIVFPLPKALKPQAYDVQFALGDSTNKTVSNVITFHYVLRGESATIQNIILDKNYYQKGDMAHATFMWSPSADTFPGSRVSVGTQSITATLTLNIFDVNKDSCIAPMNYDLSRNQKNPIVSLTLPIIRNCFNPQLSAELKNSTGVVLDSTKLNLTNTKTRKLPLPSPYLIGFLIVVVIGIVYYEMRKKNEVKIGNKQ